MADQVFSIENTPTQLLISTELDKDVTYYDKVRADGTKLLVRGASGFIRVYYEGDEESSAVNARWDSQISLPTSTSLYDLVTQVNGYIVEVDEAGNIVNVYSATDFPAAVAGVRTLADNTIYVIHGAISIGSDRLVMGINTTVRGKSPTLDYVTSTTAGALITATADFRIVEAGFQASAGVIFDLQGSGSETCLMTGVRFFGAGGLGTVDQYDLFECNIGLFVGFSAGLSFTGSNGSLILIDTEFSQTAGTPTSVGLGVATFNLIRILGCSFVTVAGGTGLAVAANGANLNVGMIGIISSSVFSGAGSVTSGYSNLDEEWAVDASCAGIDVSDRIEPAGWGYYQDGETTPATQALTTVPAKLLIDGAGANSESGYLPASILGTGELWDTVNDEITPISVGDSYSMRIDLEVTAKGGGAGAIFVQLDIGGGVAPSTVIADAVVSITKTPPFNESITISFFTLNTFVANAGQIFLSMDSGTATIAARGIVVDRHSSGAR